MIKFKIQIPVYNDWDSLIKLLKKIDFEIDYIRADFSVLILNDASTTEIPSNLNNYKNISSVSILNMKKNQGPNKTNATGISYVSKQLDFDYLILMDGDGEDRPEELKILINKILQDKNISVVAKRVKRSEGLIFQILYKFHKILTFIFTGKNMNFGHYSCLTKKDLLEISNKKDLWCNFSGTVKKHIKILHSVNSVRGLRYAGQSKVPIFKLIIHSFSIIAVFKKNVLIRSLIFSIILLFIFKEFPIFTTFLYFILFLFILIVSSISINSKEEDLLNSTKNIKDVVHTHPRRL